MREILKVRNVSGASYTVEETGTILGDGEELDLMTVYDNWDAANTLVSSLPTAKLYQGIQAGDIMIVESVAPDPAAIEGGRRG